MIVNLRLFVLGPEIGVMNDGVVSGQEIVVRFLWCLVRGVARRRRFVLGVAVCEEGYIYHGDEGDGEVHVHDNGDGDNDVLYDDDDELKNFIPCQQFSL